MPSYKIASPEGAEKYGGEIGDNVDLVLEEEEERAVIAAGWLESAKKPKEANN